MPPLFFKDTSCGKRITSIAISALMLIGSVSCAKKANVRYEAEFLVLFDTLTKIVAYMPDKDEFTAFSQFIYDNLKEYHQLYDIYHDYEGINNIKTINDHAGISPVKVDKRIIDLLALAKEKYKLTNGKFNVALGAVLKIWHDYREAGLDDPDNAQLPPLKDLKAAAQHTNIDDVVIDTVQSTVYLRDKKMSLDVGAIGKGYAVRTGLPPCRTEGIHIGADQRWRECQSDRIQGTGLDTEMEYRHTGSEFRQRRQPVDDCRRRPFRRIQRGLRAVLCRKR